MVILHFFKKNRVLHREGFSEHKPFFTVSLFFTMSVVCNISNKHWFPNKLGKQ